MGVNERCLAESKAAASRRTPRMLSKKNFGEKFQAGAEGLFVAREQVTSKKEWNFVELNGITWNFAERKTGVKAKIRSK